MRPHIIKSEVIRDIWLGRDPDSRLPPMELQKATMDEGNASTQTQADCDVSKQVGAVRNVSNRHGHRLGTVMLASVCASDASRKVAAGDLAWERRNDNNGRQAVAGTSCSVLRRPVHARALTRTPVSRGFQGKSARDSQELEVHEAPHGSGKCARQLIISNFPAIKGMR